MWRAALSKVIYDQLQAEGIELPVERPEPGPFMFLLMKSAERCWAREAMGGAT
jgi:hypothetical protein